MVEANYFDDDGRPRGAQIPEGVDPRLDNRAGRDRPPLESDPAVPQQVDGPDLMHQAEHAEAVAKLNEQGIGERKGMFSPGDHSLSDETVRRGNDAGQADDRLETDPANPGSASTNAREGDVAGTTGDGTGGGVNSNADGDESNQDDEKSTTSSTKTTRASTAVASERATAEPGERRTVSTASKTTKGDSK